MGARLTNSWHDGCARLLGRQNGYNMYGDPFKEQRYSA